MAVPSNHVAVKSEIQVVTDHFQGTSSWFTSSKGVILFPFVVLSLRRRLFPPPKALIGLLMSQIQTGLNHMTILKLIPRKQDNEITMNNVD